jgi:hypothetical protein
MKEFKTIKNFFDVIAFWARELLKPQMAKLSITRVPVKDLV